MGARSTATTATVAATQSEGFGVCPDTNAESDTNAKSDMIAKPDTNAKSAANGRMPVGRWAGRPHATRRRRRRDNPIRQPQGAVRSWTSVPPSPTPLAAEPGSAEIEWGSTDHAFRASGVCCVPIPTASPSHCASRGTKQKGKPEASQGLWQWPESSESFPRLHACTGELAVARGTPERALATRINIAPVRAPPARGKSFMRTVTAPEGSARHSA